MTVKVFKISVNDNSISYNPYKDKVAYYGRVTEVVFLGSFFEVRFEHAMPIRYDSNKFGCYVVA